MGIGDKMGNAAQDAKGKAKEAAGDATDNEQMQAEGKGEQVEAKGRKVGENVKDGVRDIKR
jgi:uncharacterized protein YjbJ (UPF0337 family)